MSDAISFTDATYRGYFDAFSCYVPTGKSALLVSSRHEECALLWRILSGITPLSEGSVAIHNVAISELKTEELIQLRRQTGSVTASGGLISNLKMWENILLPSLYHNGVISPDQEQQAEELLDYFGYTANLMVLPAKLSLFEKRMAAFIRAAIQKPALMIYAGCFDGISDNHCEKLLSAARKLASSQPQLTSLYLTSSEECAKRFTDIPMYYLHHDSNTDMRDT